MNNNFNFVGEGWQQQGGQTLVPFSTSQQQQHSMQSRTHLLPQQGHTGQDASADGGSGGISFQLNQLHRQQNLQQQQQQQQHHQQQQNQHTHQQLHRQIQQQQQQQQQKKPSNNSNYQSQMQFNSNYSQQQQQQKQLQEQPQQLQEQQQQQQPQTPYNQLQAQLQAQARLQVQQQQHLHQCLQTQAQQIQQLTAGMALPPPLGDPAGLLGRPTHPARTVIGGGKKRFLSAITMTGTSLEPKKKDSFSGNNVQDTDEGQNDNSISVGNKRKADDDSLVPPQKVSRRQQPPKTNITRTRYSNDFKRRVIYEMENPGYGTVMEISTHYGIAEQTLRDWIKNKDKISEAVQRRGHSKANPKNHLERVTTAIIEYTDGRKLRGTTMTARMIADKGQEIKHQLLERDNLEPFLNKAERKAIEKFSASSSWGKKWCQKISKEPLRKTTEVPQNLEGLSKDELVRLLRSVTTEREALLASKRDGIIKDGTEEDVDGAVTDGSTPYRSFKSKNSLPFIPPPPRVKPAVTYKVDQAKARIAEKLASGIKKKGHNWKGRPSTEITEIVPTLENVRELMAGYKEVNKTARSYRWQMNGDQIVEWLGCSKYVHPVKFDGKVVCTIGQTASVYAFAGYVSMLAKYEQGTNTLTLTVKTRTAGTGNIPGSDEPVFLCDE